MIDVDWVLNAKCRSMEMDRFFDPAENPVLLCAGCQVFDQCEVLAETPIDPRVYGAVGGEPVPVSGVVMAGKWRD